MAHTLIQPAQIAPAGASTGNVLTYNGTIWEPDTAAGGGTVTGTGTTGRITQWNSGAGGVLEDSTLIKSGAGVLTLSAASAYTLTIAAAASVSGTNTGDQDLSGLGGVPTSRTVTAGSGLTGGGALSADITLNVGAGAGITVNADDVALTTPGTLTVSSSNTATGSHTHAITSSANPGAAASILATDSSGNLVLGGEFRMDRASPTISWLDTTVPNKLVDVVLESGVFIIRDATSGNNDIAHFDLATTAVIAVGTGDSTSTTTGALQSAGGLGVAKALTVGGLAGFGTTPTAHQGMNVLITDANSGSNVWGLISVATVNGTTTGARGVFGRADTTNASFTLADATSIFAANPIKGAASTITTAYGLQIASITTGGTNYAIFTGTGVTHLGGGLRVGADGSGAASTTGFTNATNTTVTNTYIVRGGQAANTVNTGWIKIYIGTNAAWVPYWQNATP